MASTFSRMLSGRTTAMLVASVGAGTLASGYLMNESGVSAAERRKLYPPRWGVYTWSHDLHIKSFMKMKGRSNIIDQILVTLNTFQIMAFPPGPQTIVNLYIHVYPEERWHTWIMVMRVIGHFHWKTVTLCSSVPAKLYMPRNMILFEECVLHTQAGLDDRNELQSAGCFPHCSPYLVY